MAVKKAKKEIKVEFEEAISQWGQVRGYTICAKCGKEAIIDNTGHYVLSQYCPHCGCKMTNGR